MNSSMHRLRKHIVINPHPFKEKNLLPVRSIKHEYIQDIIVAKSFHYETFFSMRKQKKIFKNQKVHIRDNSFIGYKCTVLQSLVQTRETTRGD